MRKNILKLNYLPSAKISTDLCNRNLEIIETTEFVGALELKIQIEGDR